MPFSSLCHKAILEQQVTPHLPVSLRHSTSVFYRTEEFSKAKAAGEIPGCSLAPEKCTGEICQKAILNKATQRHKTKHATPNHSNGKCKRKLVFKGTLSGAIKARKRSFVKAVSSGTSCPSNKKDFFSPMTAKDKQKYWAKISQFDSNYDFYGCSNNMIYTLVVARKDFVIHLVLQKVIPSHSEQVRYVLTRTLL